MTPVGDDDEEVDELKMVRARVAISKIVALERVEDEREGIAIPWNLVGIVAIVLAACFGLYLAGSLLTSAIRTLPF